ncbi:hypothetical protein EVAR_16508_1 [Eumeta japonica]|uniref:Uncharacterized protein n=1 Tax=Eumeta variegata TaxID=151549 RepID=A0A4C1U481_EUMVA|nr:hypothetical protein EVAR_16508_1 [Eumeta japonica]
MVYSLCATAQRAKLGEWIKNSDEYLSLRNVALISVPKKQWKIDTNKKALDASLVQGDKVMEMHRMTYASRKLIDLEKKHSATGRDCLGYSIVRSFNLRKSIIRRLLATCINMQHATHR